MSDVIEPTDAARRPSGSPVAQRQSSSTPLLLEVRGLKKYFPIHKGLMRKVVNQVRGG
jgi:hypothetical protein